MREYSERVQGPGSHSQHCKKGGCWKRGRKEGSRTLSTISLTPAWAIRYLKQQCMKQGLTISSGGSEANCSNLPSGSQSSTTRSSCSVVWAWSLLQPGHKPIPHSHRPVASLLLQEGRCYWNCALRPHSCNEPCGACSRGHRNGIRQSWVVQTQLTAQAKSRSADLPPMCLGPPTTATAHNSFRVTLRRKGVLQSPCWKIIQQSLPLASCVQHQSAVSTHWKC